MMKKALNSQLISLLLALFVCAFRGTKSRTILMEYNSVSTCFKSQTPEWSVKNENSMTCSSIYTEVSTSQQILTLQKATSSDFYFHFKKPQISFPIMGVDISFVYSEASSFSTFLTFDQVVYYPFGEGIEARYDESFDITSNGLINQIRYGTTLVQNNFQAAQLSPQISVSGTGQLSIRSIRIWVNCSVNCDLCLSNSKCQTCFVGFTLHTLNSGAVVCEQSNGCAILDCAQCYIDESPKCVRCNAGFTLNTTNGQCIPNTSSQTCNSGQYIDIDGNCAQYSSFVFYQQKSASTFTQQTNRLNANDYKCLTDQTAIVIDDSSYGSYFCGCIIQNCKSCNSPSTCLQCVDGYSLNLSGTACVLCQNVNCLICLDANCLSCSNTTALGTCLVCENGYYVSNAGTCVAVTCALNEKVDSTTNTCVCVTGWQKNSSNICSQLPIQISEMMTGNGFIIKINFQFTLSTYVGQNMNSLISLEISGGTLIDTTNSIDGFTIIISIIPTISIRGKTAKIKLLDSNFIQLNNISQTVFTQNLIDYFYVSESQKALISSVGTVGQAASTTVIATILPLAILSNFYIIINTIDLTGFLYYLLFVDVRYPENVLSFYGLFKNFQFPFLPNFFEGIIPQGYSQQAPKKFLENGTDLYYIVSTGQSVSIFLIVSGIYIFGKVTSYAPIPKLQPYLKRAMYQTWEYNSLCDLLWTLYIYFLVGGLLQFYCYDKDAPYFFLNYSIHLLFTLMSVTAPFIVIYIIHRQVNIKDEVFKAQYGTLIGGLRIFGEKSSESCPHKPYDIQVLQEGIPSTVDEFKNEDFNNDSQPLSFRENLQVKCTKYYNGILYLRKLIFAIIIVYHYEHPYSQIVLISILNIFMITYIFYLKPVEKESENTKNGVGEIILLIIQILVSLLVDDEMSEDETKRLNIGWLIIGLSSLIMSWHGIQLIMELIVQVYNIIFKKPIPEKEIDKKIRPSKENDEDYVIDSKPSPSMISRSLDIEKNQLLNSKISNSVISSNNNLNLGQRSPLQLVESPIQINKINREIEKLSNLNLQN